MSSAWQSVPHATRNRTVKSIFSNWFPLLIEILDFLWQCFWIYAWTSSRFVKIKSCRFPIFCCWLCGRKKYWNPDNFTICISVNLIGSSSKTNADHLSPFCSSNSQYSMFPFQMYFPDGPDSSSILWYTHNPMAQKSGFILTSFTSLPFGNVTNSKIWARW